MSQQNDLYLALKGLQSAADGAACSVEAGHTPDIVTLLREVAEVLSVAPPPTVDFRRRLERRALEHRNRAAAMARAPAPDEVHGALGAAVEFLADALADAPRPSSHVRLEAQQSGHAQKTIRRARDYLGVRCEKRKGEWWMVLPTRQKSARIATERATTRALECEAIVKDMANALLGDR